MGKSSSRSSSFSSSWLSVFRAAAAKPLSLCVVLVVVLVASVIRFAAAAPLEPDGAEACEMAISLMPGKHNSDCKHACQAFVDRHLEHAAFYSECAIELWSRGQNTGRVYPEGSCYNQWVYGYSDEGEEGADALLSGFKTFDGVTSPAECQEKCQMETECVNFLWRGIGAPTCVLKNEMQVQKALEIKLHFDGTVWRTIPSAEWAKFCNTGLDYKCNTPGHYDCLECDASGSPSCVWESHHHIAGPKNCGDAMPVCGSLPGAPEEDGDKVDESDADNDSEVHPPVGRPNGNPPGQEEEETAAGGGTPVPVAAAEGEGTSTVVAVSAAVAGTAVVAAAAGAGAFAYTQNSPEFKEPIQFESKAELSVEYTDKELHADVDADEFVV